MDNIFDSLWVEKYRPTNLADIVIQPDVRGYFHNALESLNISHLLFYGPAGVGKTSLAKLITKELDVTYRYINASDERGIDSVREKIVPFAQRGSLDGKLKVVILDEVDGFTADAQRALRNVMEEYSDNVRFILTANYKNRIIDPIRSRVIAFDISPDVSEVVKRAAYILKNENIEVSAEQKPLLIELVKSNYPDIRRVVNALQKYSQTGKLLITKEVDIQLFAKDVIKKIKTQKKMCNVREYVIQNEADFNCDYYTLLKGMFEEVYELDIEESTKAAALTVIGKFMYEHQFVMDFEINSYCCMLQLKSLL